MKKILLSLIFLSHNSLEIILSDSPWDTLNLGTTAVRRNVKAETGKYHKKASKYQATSIIIISFNHVYIAIIFFIIFCCSCNLVLAIKGRENSARSQIVVSAQVPRICMLLSVSLARLLLFSIRFPSRIGFRSVWGFIITV